MADYKDAISKGSRVRCVRERDDTGVFIPPKGICGTVLDTDYNDLLVDWDSGVRDGGPWWCFYEDVMPSNV